MKNNFIPVTILTGFLGSGKTTLLKKLLSQTTERIVIVENEFGEINIDTHLLDTSSAIELVELTNGCVCCNVRGELTEALIALLARKDQGLCNFERIILETTGLADPAPIIQTFFVEEELRDRLQLDAIVTMVDSEYAQSQLEQHRVAVSQIGFADCILLTKTDRINDEKKGMLLSRLRQINVKAELIEVIHGQILPAQWLNLRAFDLDENPIATVNVSNFTKVNPSSKPYLTQSWNDDITSHVLKGKKMDMSKISTFMENIITHYGNDMLRFKGIFAIHGEARRLLLQGVHRVVGFDYGSSWRSDEEPYSVMVIIGRGLPVKKWNDEFMACQIE